MGILLSVCQPSPPICDANQHRRLIETIQKYRDDCRHARYEINMLEKNMKILATSCKDNEKYRNVFRHPSLVADYIMSTELHLKWMDDDTEKKYIISLLETVEQYAANNEAPLDNLDIHLMKQVD